MWVATRHITPDLTPDVDILQQPLHHMSTRAAKMRDTQPLPRKRLC